MLIALALLSLASQPAAPLAVPALAAFAQEQEQQVDVRATFVDLHSKGDEAACMKLWSEHPYEVLGTIDADLEGSLATWEKNPTKPDGKAIAAQHARALWGARLASKASGHPIFLDYASSFVGWNEQQKKDFRAGQAAYGRARGALKKKDFAAAQVAGRECADLAAPLGDWWGHAMGLSALGQALRADGKLDEAIVPLSQAILINHDLGLVGDEYSNLRALVEVLRVTKRLSRALASIDRALELARLVGDADGATELADMRESVEAMLAQSK